MNAGLSNYRFQGVRSSARLSDCDNQGIISDSICDVGGKAEGTSEVRVV